MVLYKFKEYERSFFLVQIFVIYIDVFFEVKVNSFIFFSLVGVGVGVEFFFEDGVVFEKCIYVLDSYMKSIESFFGALNCFYFFIKRKKGEK